MLRARSASRSLALLLALLLGGSAARAEEKAHGAGAHEPPPKYKAEVHDENGKAVEKTFDLSKPEDKEALEKAIQHGHVGELRKDEPPSLAKLFSLAADLGVWTLIVFG